MLHTSHLFGLASFNFVGSFVCCVSLMNIILSCQCFATFLSLSQSNKCDLSNICIFISAACRVQGAGCRVRGAGCTATIYLIENLREVIGLPSPQLKIMTVLSHSLLVIYAVGAH